MEFILSQLNENISIFIMYFSLISFIKSLEMIKFKSLKEMSTLAHDATISVKHNRYASVIAKV